MRRHSVCDSSSKGTLLKTPALLTTASSRPNVSTAVRTIASPPSGLATDTCDATATPPARSISSTTWSATLESEPSPCIELPRSFTTTAPPRRAISMAYRRPRPRPAPVTIATWPAKSIMVVPRAGRREESSIAFPHPPRRADAEQAPDRAQCIALVGDHLLRRQRIEVAGREQRREGRYVEDRGTDHRARGVERIVVDGVELSARAASFEERDARAQESLGGRKQRLRRVLVRLGRVAQDQAGERGARHDRVHPRLHRALDPLGDRAR